MNEEVLHPTVSAEAQKRHASHRPGDKKAAKNGVRRTCREAMTLDPPCCLPGDPLDVVAQVMKAAAVSTLPVVEDLTSARLVGSITERDLIIKVLAVSLDPKSTTATEVMTRAPLTCRAQDSLSKALAMMAVHQVQQVPIVDDQGRLLGIISATAPGISGKETLGVC